MDSQTRDRILTAQRAEVTEYHIYTSLARAVRDPDNARILSGIAAEELQHSRTWERYTGQTVQPDWMLVRFYYWISRLLGITFGVKLMERGEVGAQLNYAAIAQFIPEATAIAEDEFAHEQRLIGLVDEDLLNYIGSVVLGLNDALVELTGALAGFTLAIANIRLIAVTGLITGIAASLSMAASEYLSTKTEAGSKSPVRAAVYTGIAYTFAVLLLILPYLLLDSVYLALAWALLNAVALIAAFSFYTSVAQDGDFRRQFFEMTPLTLGIAALSFVIGYVVKSVFGVDV